MSEAKGKHLIRQLAALEPGPARDHAAAQALAGLEPLDAARALAEVVAAAKEGEREGAALASLGRALLFEAEEALPYSHRGRIFDAARELQLEEVASLFLRPPPATVMQDSELSEGDKALAGLTLGHKKAMARSADMDRQVRLALEGNPDVIRNLLLNPKLTEATVLRIAARRPTRPQALLEVYRCSRWSARMDVRRALAKNPYTPPELALKLLPFLVVVDLREVAQDSSLHPSVREAAGALVRKRRSQAAAKKQP